MVFDGNQVITKFQALKYKHERLVKLQRKQYHDEQFVDFIMEDSF